MFDFGFSEMLVCGVIALVVLGPERLPTVARTAGEWIGKAQRFVAQVKSDIDRETELSELKKIKDEAQSLARDVKTSVEQSAKEIESSVNDAAKGAEDVAKEANDALNDIEKAATSDGTSAEAPAADAATGDTSAASSGETASATPGGTAGTDQEIADFYGWNNDDDYDPSESEPRYEEPKVFTKRYHAGPSVDELAQEIDRLRLELGMREAQLGGNNRRLARRARSNRPRIYR
jgi:sec-independent protein translocase protein TatB